MDPLNILFGIIGIVSLVFSIYTYYKTESKKAIEAAKVAIQKERYRNIRLALLGIYHSIDGIVQIPKWAPTAHGLDSAARAEPIQFSFEPPVHG